MRCLFCGASPADGANLHRINAKGEPGVWACEKHLAQTDVEVPPDVARIVWVIGKAPDRGSA